MASKTKHSQLQVRVSAAEKRQIQEAAKRAGLDMSAYVLSRTLPGLALRFQECVAGCLGPQDKFALAELNSLLSKLAPGELREAVAWAPSRTLSQFHSNYIAAMVEYACARCSIVLPRWTQSIEPLEQPAFGTDLQGLRLYLLTHSPAPFRRRNIFIDSSLGQQI
jgi:Protein of unknown function (DUF1778)